MKYLSLLVALLYSVIIVHAQSKYPEPEFTNELYFLKKDSAYSVVRLEKGSSKMESKAKMAGLGGAESGYSINDSKSPVRLSPQKNFSFVLSTGASVKKTSKEADSVMLANGFDPAMMSSMGETSDPSNTIALYKVESSKGKRKVIMQKSPSALPFGSKKIQSSDKYTFSVKKIREGYWELVIDKTLPRGEYVFTVHGMGMNNMDGSITLFAFGVE
jgi:hypothetical protein